MLPYAGIVPVLLLFQFTLAQNVPLRGPPQFEMNPQYLDSYIPASMQVIAYLTEMMKYDIKPTVTTTTQRPTTTKRTPTNRPITIQLTTKRPLFTAPPTPYHKPALYAPYHPPGFIITRNESPLVGETSTVDSYQEYVNRLKNPLADYFDRYRQVDSISSIIDQLIRQRRAIPFNYTAVPTEKSNRNDVPNARRSSRSGGDVILFREIRAKPFVHEKANINVVRQNIGQEFLSIKDSRGQPPAEKKPELNRSRSIRSVVEELEEPSSPILQRKIRANPFTPVKANTNVVRQNNGQEFRSNKNSRGQLAEKKPELSRSRSIRSVVEELEEPSSPILQRKIRANPFTPVKANTNVVRQNTGQEFRSNKNSRGQLAEKKPELSRSRSIRSVVEEVEEPSSPILQRKIRANPFTAVKANTNVVRQNTGQEFRSNKNSRGQLAEKKPELSRSRSIRSVVEELEEPSSPILQRKIRANPFTPVKANTNVVRQNTGQEFRSNKNSRGQLAEKKPELSRSRSIRSVVEELEEPSSPILQRKIRANPFTPVKANTNVVRQNNGQEFRSIKNSRGHLAEKKPELSRSRSIRSVLEEVEEPSSPILQRKIRANPFTPVKANTNVVRQNNGQEFRSIKNSRGHLAEKKPELSRSRSIRSVVEEVEEPSSPILQRKIRANPFTPVKANTNVVRQNNGQEFRSIKNSRGQLAEKKPELSRSRSIRSVLEEVEEPSSPILQRKIRANPFTPVKANTNVVRQNNGQEFRSIKNSRGHLAEKKPELSRSRSIRSVLEEVEEPSSPILQRKIRANPFTPVKANTNVVRQNNGQEFRSIKNSRGHLAEKKPELSRSRSIRSVLEEVEEPSSPILQRKIRANPFTPVKANTNVVRQNNGQEFRSIKNSRGHLAEKKPELSRSRSIRSVVEEVEEPSSPILQRKIRANPFTPVKANTNVVRQNNGQEFRSIKNSRGQLAEKKPELSRSRSIRSVLEEVEEPSSPILQRKIRANPFTPVKANTNVVRQNNGQEFRSIKNSRGHLAEKKPELSRSRSIRSVLEEVEEPSSPILQRKIRANPFTPVKANTNVVRQNNGQEFRSIKNSRGHLAEKKPELSRSRSIRSVVEEVEEPSSPILQRKIRANPFTPVKANTNVVRQNNGQEFRSIKNSRGQLAEKKPELSRSRSIRSVLEEVEEPSSPILQRKIRANPFTPVKANTNVVRQNNGQEFRSIKNSRGHLAEKKPELSRSRSIRSVLEEVEEPSSPILQRKIRANPFTPVKANTNVVRQNNGQEFRSIKNSRGHLAEKKPELSRSRSIRSVLEEVEEPSSPILQRKIRANPFTPVKANTNVVRQNNGQEFRSIKNSRGQLAEKKPELSRSRSIRSVLEEVEEPSSPILQRKIRANPFTPVKANTNVVRQNNGQEFRSIKNSRGHLAEKKPELSRSRSIRSVLEEVEEPSSPILQRKIRANPFTPVKANTNVVRQNNGQEFRSIKNSRGHLAEKKPELSRSRSIRSVVEEVEEPSSPILQRKIRANPFTPVKANTNVVRQNNGQEFRSIKNSRGQLAEKKPELSRSRSIRSVLEEVEEPSSPILQRKIRANPFTPVKANTNVVRQNNGQEFRSIKNSRGHLAEKKPELSRSRSIRSVLEEVEEPSSPILQRKIRANPFTPVKANTNVVRQNNGQEFRSIKNSRGHLAEKKPELSRSRSIRSVLEEVEEPSSPILQRKIRANPFTPVKANTNVVRQNNGQEFRSIKNSRGHLAEKKPELSRSRSIRSVVEEVEEPSSPILQRKIRANPFTPVKANTNVVRQNNGQEFRSIKNSRGQLAEKKPELNRSRSIRSVLEEVEEPSSPILQRKIRANPFTPVKANTNVVRQNNGQEFRSNKNSRGQPAEKKPELSRSRSIRSVLEEVEEPSSPILQRKIRANPFTPVKANTNVVRQNNGQEFRSNKNSRGQPAQKKPELSRSRSIRSVLEEVEEPSSPILQRKIRANPFTPVKANTNVVRQNNGQEFRSIKNSRGQLAEKKPELSRSRSIRSVLEEVEEPSSRILQRKIRANPFTPVKANTNVVRQNTGQEFRSNKNSRGQPAQKKPELSRSRSIRSVIEEILIEDEIESDIINQGEVLSDGTTISTIGGLNSASEKISVGKVPLFMTDLRRTPLEMIVSSDTNKVKGRALSINGDNFNVRSVDYLGFGLNELIKEIQSERESVENRLTDDDRVKLFSTKYDDVNFGSYLLRQKKIPPTKAYVTLLSLYDLLNKESKKLMLNKYNGYATAIVEELIETSSGTSSEQLRTILQRIVDRPDTYDPPIRSKITSLVTDLSTSNSYINDALRYIPPLPFSR